MALFKKLHRKVFTYFLQGLMALLPLIVSGYLLVFLFKLVEDLLQNVLIFLPRAYRDIPLVVITSEVIAALILFSLMVFIGFIVKSIIGKAFLQGLDSLFIAIPGLNTIYNAVRQVIDLFLVKKDSFFTKPCLVEYPSPGIWAVAFNTGEMSDNHPSGNSGQKFYTVFIPTTPNPTSGFLAVLPQEKIHPLNISVEEAVKMILTGGMIKQAEKKKNRAPVTAAVKEVRT
ncbi:MAG: DUF502 domain-containing protein [Fibrobacter sp.]|nr:DUF502 domain-containing protein [Fibrobacter sp.]